MIWTAWVNSANSRYPIELTNENQAAPTQPRTIGHGDHAYTEYKELNVGHRFRADDENSARRTFNYWAKNGLPPNPFTTGDPPARNGERVRWRHKGAPHYLYAQATLMGIPDDEVKSAGHNEEIKKLDREMGGLNGRYHEAMTAQVGRFDDFPQPVKTIAAASLRDLERRAARLHMLAAASVVEIDDAWKAFGMDVPERSYHVTIGPAPIVEVRSTEDTQKIDAQNVEIASLKADIERLEMITKSYEASKLAEVPRGTPVPSDEFPVEPTVEPPPAPVPIQPPLPVRKPQNPNHPRNAGVR